MRVGDGPRGIGDSAGLQAGVRDVALDVSVHHRQVFASLAGRFSRTVFVWRLRYGVLGRYGVASGRICSGLLPRDMRGWQPSFLAELQQVLI
jgi:hypothetical protein